MRAVLDALAAEDDDDDDDGDDDESDAEMKDTDGMPVLPTLVSSPKKDKKKRKGDAMDVRGLGIKPTNHLHLAG